MSFHYNGNHNTKTHGCTHMPSNVPACELLFNFAIFSCDHNRESSKSMPSLSTCLAVVLLHVCTCYFCNRLSMPFDSHQKDAKQLRYSNRERPEKQVPCDAQSKINAAAFTLLVILPILLIRHSYIGFIFGFRCP